jgi:hypothetical protein
MIWRIVRKDWTLLWPLAVLLTAIQLAFEWGNFRSGFAGGGAVAGELVRLLELPWYIGIIALAIAVVHEDTIPGADQDWLIRPLVRTHLLLAKMLFVVLTICVPMVGVNFAHELALGFPALPSFADALYKVGFLFMCLIVPAMALASATRNMTELLVLLAGLVVTYAVSLWLSATLTGGDRCPTCDTGVSWLQHQLQHVEVFIGSAVILALQYYRRRTDASRLVAMAGVIALVFVQLPWNAAFYVQTRLGAVDSGPLPAAAPVTVEIDGAAADAAAVRAEVTYGAARGRPGSARSPTQALFHGNLDAAVENLKRITRPEDAPLVLDIPVNVTGLAADGFLVADRAEFALLEQGGSVLFRGRDVPRYAVPLSRQTVEIPAAVYRQVQPRVARLSLDYSLTLMDAVAEHKIRAVDGEFRSSDLGLCRTAADSNGLHFRCRQIGRAPSCYAATLYGPDGRHNPQVLECSLDYRPYIPSPMNIINFVAIDLPTHDASGLAHYDVDLADLPHAYLIVTVYRPREHFRRTVTTALHLAE